MAGIADILAARAPAQLLLNDMEAAHDGALDALGGAEAARDDAAASEARTIAVEGLVASGYIDERVDTYDALPETGTVGVRYYTEDSGSVYAWAPGGTGGGYSYQYKGTLSQRSASSRTAAQARHGGPGTTMDVDGYGRTEWSPEEAPGPAVTQRLLGLPAAGGGTWLIQSRNLGVLKPEWLASPSELADPATCAEVLSNLALRAEGTMQTVELNPAQVYEVKCGWNGETQINALQYADGFRLRSGMRLKTNGALIRVEPTASGLYAPIFAYDAVDVHVDFGGGKVLGDRDTHLGTGGEYGNLIAIQGGGNIHIRDGYLEEGWGDGCVVGRSLDGPCRGWSLTNIHTRGNRRQGISFISAENGLVLGGSDRDTASVNGTAPGFGLDFECDNPDHPNRDIAVIGRRFSGNAKSIGATVFNEDIRISNCHGTDRSGIVVDGEIDGWQVDNSSFGPRTHAETQSDDGALVILAQTPGNKKMTLTNVRLRGGNIFTVILAPQADQARDISLDTCVVTSLPGQTKIATWDGPQSQLRNVTFTVPAGAAQPPLLFPGRREARSTTVARHSDLTFRSLATGDATYASVLGTQEGIVTLNGVTDQAGRTGQVMLPSVAASQSSLTTASIGTGPGNSAVVQVPGVPGQPPDVRQVRGSSLIGSEAAAVDWVAYAVPLGDATGAVVLTNRSSGAQTYTIYYVAP